MATATREAPAGVAASAAPTATKFHISLNVANLDSAIAFYRVLLGVGPAKCYPDYAKFEMSDPPLVLSLEPQEHAVGGALNHLGFRVPTPAALVDVQHRLDLAGIKTNREDGVECCYARQTKFWVHDADRNLWEVYVLEGDTDHRGAGSAPDVRDHLSHGHEPAAAKAPTPAVRAEVEWEHKLGQAFPSAIPLADASADRILLRGTLNAALSSGEIACILQESRRVLRPGGRIVTHGLGADADLNDQPVNLPGPAAAVERVPSQTSVIDALISAGFASVRLLKLSSTPVFRHGAVGLREILVEGRRFDSTPFDLRQTVLYQGPLREVTDDFGNVFVRGTPTAIPTPAVESLRAGPISESFIFFPPGGDK